MSLKDITKRANAVLSVSEIRALFPSMYDTVDELNRKTKKMEAATKKYQEILTELKNLD